jgi:nucleoside-diphosphate-sugar epimerase
VEVVLGDVRDPDSVRDAVKDVEVVYHLAALVGIPWSYRTPLAYVRTNVEGTVNLLQAAAAAGAARFVHTSTSEVYGTAQRVPIDESHPLRAQSPYAASKVAADAMAEAFHRSYGLPVIVVRPFNAYGPRQSARAIVAATAVQALTRDVVRLGNLRPTRDLTFVEDTVEAFALAGSPTVPAGQVVNVGTGRETSVEDLARTIVRLVGRDVPIETEDARTRPAASEVERLCADASRAKALLGWEPRHSLEEGLRRTISWIEANLGRYRADAYAV